MNLWERLTGETPKFFKLIIKIGIALLAVGLGIIAASESGVVFPEIVLEIAKQFIWIGTVATIVSKLTLVNPDEKAEAKEYQYLNL